MAPFHAADLLRRKPVAQIEGEHPPESLHRSIGLFQLTMLGVGATIGTGTQLSLSGQWIAP